MMRMMILKIMMTDNYEDDKGKCDDNPFKGYNHNDDE